MKLTPAQTRLAAFALLLVLLAAWELASRASGLSALVLPAPSAVGRSLWMGLSSGYLWPHILSTGLEVLLGLAIGCVIGFASGVLMAESALLAGVLKPYVVVSQVIPKLALMPLFIVWFGFGLTSTVVITALICFFPLLENTMTALAQVPADRLELFRLLGASRWQTLWRLKLPTGLPAVLADGRIVRTVTTTDDAGRRDTPAFGAACAQLREALAADAREAAEDVDEEAVA